MSTIGYARVSTADHENFCDELGVSINWLFMGKGNFLADDERGQPTSLLTDAGQPFGASATVKH
jgi:hypothetical protein